MKREITKKEIEFFRKKYQENPMNQFIENTITRVGLKDACFNPKTLIENQDIFNVETELGKATDQKGSGRCWCFAATNMIRSDIAKNMNIDIKDCELSNNYISFFDKLEKINNIYENVLESDNLDYDHLIEDKYLNYSEGGWLTGFSYIVNKYGIVPAQYMPETHDSVSSTQLMTILNEKIAHDINHLIQLVEKKTSIDKIRETKNEMLSEVYEILCKVLGEPISEFTLEYMDKDKKLIRKEHMTPLKFKENYLSLNLDDFIMLQSIDHYKKDFYQKYQEEKISGPQNKKKEYINVPQQEIETSAIKQLKDNLPVWFAGPTNQFWNRKEWILDTRNFNFEQLLGIEKLDVRTSYNFREMKPSHAMCLVAVHLINDQPVRWKVENSWGNEKDTKQYLIMNQNYFKERIYTVFIHKKYLSQDVLACLDQKPIVIGPHEF